MSDDEIERLYEDCVFDTCNTETDSDEYMCAIATETMDKCYQKGIKDDWRTEDFCGRSLYTLAQK